jgi:hypothetical protein
MTRSSTVPSKIRQVPPRRRVRRLDPRPAPSTLINLEDGVQDSLFCEVNIGMTRKPKPVEIAEASAAYALVRQEYLEAVRTRVPHRRIARFSR